MRIWLPQTRPSSKGAGLNAKSAIAVGTALIWGLTFSLSAPAESRVVLDPIVSWYFDNAYSGASPIEPLARYWADAYPTITPSCKPVAILPLGVVPDAQGVIKSMMVWQFLLQEPCPSNPDHPNINYTTAVCEFGGMEVNGVNVCAHLVSDGDPDPNKNKGDPDCPACTAGNPINVGIRNKYQREVDFESPYDGGISFVRYYNSSWGQPIVGPIGAAWSHNWSKRIEVIAPDRVFAARGDGKRFLFTNTASDWTSDPDVVERLQQTSNGWLLVNSRNETEEYDQLGSLASVTSASGQKTVLTYADGNSTTGPTGGTYDGSTNIPLAQGELLRITDFKGRSVQISYRGSIGQGANAHPTSLFSSITLPSGVTYKYDYDANSNLISVRYIDGDSAHTQIGGRNYVYAEPAFAPSDRPFLLTGIELVEGPSSTQVTSRYATFVYSSEGLASSTEHNGKNKFVTTALAADPNDVTLRTATVTDPLLTQRTFTFKTVNGVAKVRKEAKPKADGSSGQSIAINDFDANGNVTGKVDHNGFLTCFDFDPTRNLETRRVEALSGTGDCQNQIRTPDTRTSTTEWSAVWRAPKRIAEPLRIVTYEYHDGASTSCVKDVAEARMLPCKKTVQATTDPDGSLGFGATSDGAARVTTYEYGSDGQLTKVDGPRDDVSDQTTYAYYASDDPAGKWKRGDLKSVTNAVGHVTQFAEYDANGRVLTQLDPNLLETKSSYAVRGWLKSRSVGTAGSGYEVTTFEYYADGLLKKVAFPDGSFASYDYDTARRLTDIRDALGNHVQFDLDDAGNRTKESTYDANGALKKLRTRVMNASINQVEKEIGGSDPVHQVRSYGYDDLNHVITIVDPNSRTTIQSWDGLGRLSKIIDPFSGATHPTLYEYYANDQLKTVTNPRGLSTTYEVNGHGEVKKETSPNTGVTSYTFDPAGNMWTKTDARGRTATFQYDALNRLKSRTYDGSSESNVTYTYDAAGNLGRLAGFSDASGATTFDYDLHGRVSAKSQTVSSVVKTIKYEYNAFGQLHWITTPTGHRIEYLYDNGRPVAVNVDGQAVLSSAGYLPFGPVSEWAWGNGTQSAPNSHKRQHDLDYRPSEFSSTLPGANIGFDYRFDFDKADLLKTITDVAGRVPQTTFTYDALDRLATAALAGTTTHSFTYDFIGNRLTAGGVTWTYEPGTDRLSTTGPQTPAFSYDPAGNVTSRNGATWQYGADGRPRSAGSVSFGFNGLGQRVLKGSGGGSRIFMYDEAGKLAGEYDGNGAMMQEMVWLGDIPVATLTH